MIWIVPIVVTLMAAAIFYVIESAMVPAEERLPRAIWFYRASGLFVVFVVTAGGVVAQTPSAELRIERNTATLESIDDRVRELEGVRAGTRIAVLETARTSLEQQFATMTVQNWGILGGLLLMIGGQIAQIRLASKNGQR